MNMRERIARALAAEEGYMYDPVPYDARADAVLDALMEPDEGMLDKMQSWIDAERSTLLFGWQAALTAARSGGER